MSFIAPMMWALLALSIPVVVAFLSRKKVAQRVVPSLVILKHIKAAEPRSRSFATPRNLLALLLYLLAVLALVIASAQPSFEGEEPRQVVIVLDASYSMGVRAEDAENQTLFDLARVRIEEDVLAGLGPRDRATLIVGDVARRVHVEPTRDLARHIEALKSLDVAGLQQHVNQSLELADALCRGQENGQIVFVTDGVVHGSVLPKLVCPHTVLRVREPQDAVPQNVALTRIAARQLDALGNTEVYVELYNATTASRDVVVEMALDGAVVEVLAISVPAGRSAGKLTRVDGSMGTQLVARIVHQEGQRDAIAMDDVGYAVLNPISWVNVLLVSDRKFSFMERAFSLHPRVRLEVSGVAEAAGKMEDRDLVIFEEGASQALLAAVPKKAKLMMLGAQPGAGISFEEEIERPVVTWWDFEDELFRYVNLDEVEVLAATPVEAAPGDEVLMRAGEDQALLVRREVAGHEALVMAFHPEQSDLVLRVAFANMIANLVEWCAASIAPPASHHVRPGETLLDAPGARRLMPISLTGSEPLLASAPMRQMGIWEIDGGEATGELVVVNQKGYGESLLEVSPEQFESYATWDTEGFSAGDRGAKLIQWLLLAALALMSLEAVVMWWKSRASGRKARTGPLSERVSRVSDEEEGRR